MKAKAILSALLLSLLALPVWALDLAAAKSQGLVGETPSGYLAAVKGGGEAKQLVDGINAQRRAKYQDIARQNKIELSAVEQLAGKKAIEKTPPGEFVQLPSGKWIKK